MVVLFLVFFKGISILFSIVTVSIYIPTSNSNNFIWILETVWRSLSWRGMSASCWCPPPWFTTNYASIIEKNVPLHRIPGNPRDSSICAPESRWTELWRWKESEGSGGELTTAEKAVKQQDFSGRGSGGWRWWVGCLPGHVSYSWRNQ